MNPETRDDARQSIEGLLRKYGDTKTHEIMEHFSTLYRVHHHKDHDSYRGLSRQEIFEKYQTQKINTLRRYISLNYRIRRQN